MHVKYVKYRVIAIDIFWNCRILFAYMAYILEILQTKLFTNYSEFYAELNERARA